MAPRKLLILKIFGATLVALITVAVWVGRPTNGLVVTFLDVGQGDAILIRTPGGNDILVDGGPDGRVIEALHRHLPASDRTFELVVLTHPDLDHVGGLAQVTQKFKVERVLETLARGGSQASRDWEAGVARQKSEVIQADTNDTLELDGVVLRVLWPPPGLTTDDVPVNDTSVVVLLEYGETSLILTGDVSTEVEERLVQMKLVPDVDVLKVAHHGSISSSDEGFLDAAKPEIAVISAGRGNKFGHPHPVVLRRLEQRGIRVLRTDQLGDIVIRPDTKGSFDTP